MNRVKLPENINNEMKLYRQGFAAIPQSYIDFHVALARQSLKKIESDDFIVHREWIACDGWLDGMKVVYAVIEDTTGNLFKIHWHDGNQEFFLNRASGGSSPLKDAIKRR